jgi:Protein of unknown function (DUF3617)
MRAHLLVIPAGLLWALPAAASDMPKRKAGLWEIKMMVGGRAVPMRNIKQCTDAETDSLLSTGLGGTTGSDCGDPKITRNGDAITVDSTCKIAGVTTTSRAVFAGDFDSAYTVAVTSRPEADAASAASAGQPQMTMDAKWLGPCRKGQKPGDVIMPGGFKLNIRSLAIGSGRAARP